MGRRVGRAGGLLLACALLAPLVTATAAGTASAAPALPSSSVEKHEAQVAAATAGLDKLSAAAGRALEDYQSALRAEADARSRQLEQQLRLDSSQEDARRSRADLGRWARLSYQTGGGSGDLAQWLALLQGSSPADFGQDLATFRNVTADKRLAAQRAAAAERVSALQTAQAEASAAATVVATSRAAAVRERSQQLVDHQRAQLATVNALLRDARSAALEAARRKAALQRAQTMAEADRLAGLSRPSDLVRQYFDPTQGCQGGDVSQFANGTVPASALCPLWGAQRHLLRADAAQAFERLSKAWSADHGKPLCVTDSYRPLADQVRLYATKPALAARPGTSNHGWGVALDLCGGIQQFGSPAHEWMRRNAPQYGWFHPQWARQGGSKPEAWHWEFAG